MLSFRDWRLVLVCLWLRLEYLLSCVHQTRLLWLLQLLESKCVNIKPKYNYFPSFKAQTLSGPVLFKQKRRRLYLSTFGFSLIFSIFYFKYLSRGLWRALTSCLLLLPSSDTIRTVSCLSGQNPNPNFPSCSSSSLQRLTPSITRSRLLGSGQTQLRLHSSKHWVS